jgi:DNA-binding XRE family transcriptional regulator
MKDALKESRKNSEFRKEVDKHLFATKIGCLVWQGRKNKKMTQKELAKKVGTTQRIISEIEWGNYCPGIFLFVRLHDVLDLEIEKSISILKNKKMKKVWDKNLKK